MANRYEILDLLATGGMAEIYRARSIGAGGFQKPVVVKKILPSFTSDPEFVRMFIEEAKLAAQLHHGNIVQVYDLGTTQAGEYFIVMELVHGHDLGDLLHDIGRQGRPFGFGEAIYLARQVCAGLDYAHRKLDRDGRSLGIIHRDVSPQNVLISFEGEVKLTDFGIAKARTRTQQTQVGFLKGKYGYMSPEQARGEVLDQRSDLFNVGILLYEALAGERLFQGSNDFSTLNQMRNVEVVPLERLRADLPESLVSIVHQTLAPEPGDRFQSAAELDKALSRLAYETSMVMGPGDLARLLEGIYGRPSDKSDKLTATRVIDLMGLPAEIVSDAGDVVGTPADLRGWDDPPPPVKPASGQRPPTVSIQPARPAMPRRALTSLSRTMPPLPRWASGASVLLVALPAFLLGLALAWPWGGKATSELLPVGGELAVAEGEGAAAKTSETRSLLVQSDPAGTWVKVDDQTRARSTPVLLTLPRDGAEHQLELGGQQGKPWKRAVAPPEHEGLGEVEAELGRDTVQVKVRTRPSRASLTVGETPSGNSPRNLELPPGRHSLIARRRGYQPARAELEVPATRRLTLALWKKGQAGKLQVLTYPAATVRVGPRIVEADAEGVIVELPAGVHRLEVEAEPLPARTLEVEVVQGRTTRVFVDLMLSSPRP